MSIYPAVADTPDFPPHSNEMADITITEKGHAALIQTIRISAAMGLRLVLDEKLLQNIQNEHAQWQAYGLENELITQDMIRKKQ